MRNHRRTMAVSALSTLLVLPLVAHPAVTAQQDLPPAQTTVVNTSNNPVPVVQQGTANVSVVTLPAVGIDPANNTVRVDQNGRIPVSLDIDVTYSPGSVDPGVYFSDWHALPEGKRFVIEHVFGSVEMNRGDEVFGELCVDTNNDLQIDRRFRIPFVRVMSTEPHLPHIDYLVANLPMKLYLSRGSRGQPQPKIMMQLWRDAYNQPAVAVQPIVFTLSGYYEDAE